MSDQVVLHVVLEALPGREGELLHELEALVAPTRKEPGCVAYQLHSDAERPGVFMFYERFASQAALDAHLETEHFKRFGQYRATANPDPVAKVTVARWQPVD